MFFACAGVTRRRAFRQLWRGIVIHHGCSPDVPGIIRDYSLFMSVVSAVLGRKLANREVHGRKIGALQGIPAMGLDGLGSASYGPEAMLTVLVAAGSAGPWHGAAAYAGDPGAARRSVPVLLANHRRLPEQWRLLHGGTREPRGDRGAPGCGGADGGLHAERRGRHLGRCRCAHLGDPGAASGDVAAVSGDPRRDHAREPARDARSRCGARAADLSVHRQPAARPRPGHSFGVARVRAPGPGDRPALPGWCGQCGHAVACVARLLRRLHRDDRHRGRQQRRGASSRRRPSDTPTAPWRPFARCSACCCSASPISPGPMA